MNSFTVFLIFVNSVQCANILGVFISLLFTRQIIYLSLCRALSLRGHQVTVITPFAFDDPTLTNLTEINVEFVHEIMKGRNRQTYFSKDFGIWQTSHDIFGCIGSIAEIILNSTKLQELIDDPNRKFDLIMMELLHPVLFGFAARFEAPSIGISTGSLFSYKYDATGHLQHPGVYCDQFLNVRTLSLGGKFQSIASFLWCKFYYQWVFFPRAHGMATKYFGKVPYVGDLEKNLSLYFTGVNSIIPSQEPRTSANVEIGPIHIQPTKPLQEVNLT
jgi:glucuronosyltransferase